MPSGVHRAVRVWEVKKKIIRIKAAVINASRPAASSALSPRPGCVAPRCSDRVVWPHATRKAAAAASAPKTCAAVYPARSWGWTFRWIQNAA